MEVRTAGYDTIHKIQTKRNTNKNNNYKRKKTSERFWLRSRQVHLTATKVRMSTMVPTHPLVRENRFIQLEPLFLFESPNFVWESDWLQLQPQVTAILRDQVCPSSNKQIIITFKFEKKYFSRSTTADQSSLNSNYYLKCSYF